MMRQLQRNIFKEITGSNYRLNTNKYLTISQLQKNNLAPYILEGNWGKISERSSHGQYP